MTAPATEKAAPIPAEVEKLARKIIGRLGHRPLKLEVREVSELLLSDRTSQEERIREDERDALFLAAERAKRRHIRSWIGMRGGMFPADRARQRGDAS